MQRLLATYLNSVEEAVVGASRELACPKSDHVAAYIFPDASQWQGIHTLIFDLLIHTAKVASLVKNAHLCPFKTS